MIYIHNMDINGRANLGGSFHILEYFI